MQRRYHDLLNDMGFVHENVDGFRELVRRQRNRMELLHHGLFHLAYGVVLMFGAIFHLLRLLMECFDRH